MFTFLIAFVRLFSSVRRSLADPEFRALLALLVSLLLGGTIFYSRVEGWPMLDALYFAVATLSTTGYGDLTPTTNGGKIFTIVYIAIGVGVFAALVGKIALAEIRRPRKASDASQDG
jgi:voltage-gated potassium channel